MLGHRVIEGLGVLAWLVCKVGFVSHLLACVSGQAKSSDRTVPSNGFRTDPGGPMMWWALVRIFCSVMLCDVSCEYFPNFLVYGRD